MRKFIIPFIAIAFLTSCESEQDKKERLEREEKMRIEQKQKLEQEHIEREAELEKEKNKKFMINIFLILYGQVPLLMLNIMEVIHLVIVMDVLK